MQGNPVLHHDAQDAVQGEMQRWGVYFNAATHTRRSAWFHYAAITSAVVLALFLAIWVKGWYSYGQDLCAPAYFGDFYTPCAITSPRPPADPEAYARLRGMPVVVPTADAMRGGLIEITLRGFYAHVSVVALDQALRDLSRGESCVCAIDLALPISALGVGGKTMFAPRIETASTATAQFSGLSSSAAAATGFAGRTLSAPQETRVSYETPAGTVRSVSAFALETACITWCAALTRHVAS